MDIINIQKAVTAEADRLLNSASNLILEVKKVLQVGSDTLQQAQVEEWLLVIPVMIAELSPVRDAYELTRKLYEIDDKQVSAQTLLDTTEKGGRREAIITINTKEQELNKALMYYIRDRAGNMVDALHSLLMSLMKIYGAKIAQPTER